jgi:hypothetical protein
MLIYSSELSSACVTSTRLALEDLSLPGDFAASARAAWALKGELLPRTTYLGWRSS